MSTRLRDLMMGELGALRHEPTEKRIRGTLGGITVVDSTSALLVWEPKRVVPTYAVPAADVAAELVASEDRIDEPAGIPAMGAPQLGDRPVLDPSIPFAVHTTTGQPLTSRARRPEAAAFRPSDPALDGYVLLEFEASTPGTRRTSATSPPARPVPPDRHRPQLAPRAGRARRRDPGRVHAALPAVRAAVAGPLLPAPRGRPHGPPRAERHPHRMRVQGSRPRTSRRPPPTTSPGTTPSRCARRRRSRAGSRSSTSAPTW